MGREERKPKKEGKKQMKSKHAQREREREKAVLGGRRRRG